MSGIDERFATEPWPSLDSMAIAVAAEFGSPDPRAVGRALDRLGASLRWAQGLAPGEQVRACVGMLIHCEQLVPSREMTPETLMIDRVVAGEPGHPVMLALIESEAARRAGIPLAPIECGGRYMLGHKGTDPPCVADPCPVRAPMPEDLPPGCWQCAHQVAFTLLTLISESYSLRGDIAQAIHASELRGRLPVCAALSGRVSREVKGLRARLN